MISYGPSRAPGGNAMGKNADYASPDDQYATGVLAFLKRQKARPVSQPHPSKSEI